MRLGTTDEPISIASRDNLVFAHGVGVEDNVAVCLSELCELGASVVRLRGSGAVYKDSSMSKYFIRQS